MQSNTRCSTIDGSTIPRFDARCPPFFDVVSVSYTHLEAERRAINDFAKQIDITNSAVILGYGSVAQKKISDFSDTALGSVKNKDFGEVGTMITGLITNLQSMNEDAEEKGGFFGVFKNTKRDVYKRQIIYRCWTSLILRDP